MPVKLTEIEGIGPAYAAALENAGVSSIEQLLKKGGSPKGRAALAEASGMSAKRILGWVNRADLARIKGVGSEYADLLEFAGVDTVPELAQRNAKNLHAQMLAVNEERKLVRNPPTQAQVADWIEQAKQLPRAVTY
jgi:predicted flap endonuclease-1-like 5' DNA nuclease